ncbi:hypothetical protein, partial [Stenotrophomonas indicatrix]|uniref:hypothetical protein n=1 Tax=Stenotrophomonas indicatrix TaxID=2045451 RepID=UPI00320A776B
MEKSKTMQLQRGPARQADYVILLDPSDIHPRMAWICCVDQGRHPPKAGHAIPTDRGNLSKAGWVRLRGRERHGWRDRAYMDVLAAS